MQKTIKTLFWKILGKKRTFFGTRSPSQLIYIGAKGAIRKSEVGQATTDVIKAQRGTLRLVRESEL